jgi:hypothetical protein
MPLTAAERAALAPVIRCPCCNARVEDVYPTGLCYPGLPTNLPGAASSANNDPAVVVMRRHNWRVEPCHCQIDEEWANGFRHEIPLRRLEDRVHQPVAPTPDPGALAAAQIARYQQLRAVCASLSPDNSAALLYHTQLVLLYDQIKRRNLEGDFVLPFALHGTVRDWAGSSPFVFHRPPVAPRQASRSGGATADAVIDTEDSPVQRVRPRRGPGPLPRVHRGPWSPLQDGADSDILDTLLAQYRADAPSYRGTPRTEDSALQQMWEQALGEPHQVSEAAMLPEEPLPRCRRLPPVRPDT